MCGVVGIASVSAPIPLDAVSRALATLRHRGPDGAGTLVADEGRVVLGHARLSIIDLSTGAQPISNEEGDIHIVVNGEFYDHERIRSDLEARGHRFRTRSDSEVLVHLYEEYGVNCFKYLRGEFAFVLWDEK